MATIPALTPVYASTAAATTANPTPAVGFVVLIIGSGFYSWSGTAWTKIQDPLV